jgi:chorismate mutase
MHAPPQAHTVACRGIRGAVAAASAAPADVRTATGELLSRVLADNGAGVEDVAAAIFTLGDDLAGANPAAAARASGWGSVPLLMVREHGADDRVANCLRVLVLVNTGRSQAEIRHVYLGEAAALRPDLAPAQGTG